MDLTKAIDFHCHYNSGAPKEQETSLIYRCDMDFLRSERKRLGVVATFTSSFASLIDSSSVIEENEKLRALAQKYDDVFQWVVLDPRSKDSFLQTERIFELPKTVGIKIHSPYHGYSICDYADDVFGFANERCAAVLMHPDNIGKMVEYADRYPQMKLIIAHLGSIEHIDAIAEAKYGNIYTDTSGIASSKNNVIEYAVDRIGADKIFFGTDTYSVAFQRGRIEFADIRDEDKQKIFFKNALELLSGIGKTEIVKKLNK